MMKLAPYNICFFRTNIEAMDRFYMDVLTLLHCV